MATSRPFEFMMDATRVGSARTVLVLVLFCSTGDVLCSSTSRLVQGVNADLDDAFDFLREYDGAASKVCFRVRSAQWNYATNMTDFNKRQMIEAQIHKAKFDKVTWKKAITFSWSDLPDSVARRQLKMLVTSGRASLPDDKYNEIHHLVSEMKDIYSQTRICPYSGNSNKYCDIELEPDIVRLMAHSRNPTELLHVWREWHDNVGPPMKNKFMRYVQLANQAARMIGFSDAGEQMRSVYEDEDFEYEVADAFYKLLPLYKHLFTYVRRKLYERYGGTVLRKDGPIPAHLLGNLWAQDWSNIGEIVAPHLGVKVADVTEQMLKEGYTPARLYHGFHFRIFQMSEEFFTSMGLKPMPPEFWRHSLFEKPSDRKVQCTSSAWDFCNGIDYRIKQCTEVNMESLLTTHHEMAHIQYYLQYQNEPYLFRDGANPGFHEGIANAIVLSVSSPTHLQHLGFTGNTSDSFESSMNFLMQMALKKVAYAPFAYLIDQWRYTVFKEGVQTMNSAWWELRLRYQGVVPPLPRNEQFFDPVGKRHIAADVPYTKYFVALLLEFQIHEALCYAAGHVGQLHACDVYRSREAGKLLKETLGIGKARHWKDVIRILTKGQNDRLSAEPMLKYFLPLELWLKVQNREEQVVGWNINPEDNALLHSVAISKAYGTKVTLIYFNFVVLLVFFGTVIFNHV